MIQHERKNFRFISGCVFCACLMPVFMSGCFNTEGTVGNLVNALIEDLSEVPANILLISIDTLRADRLGSYGYPDGYSPTLDRLAANGFIHTTAYTVMPHTTPAHASMLTGLYPVGHGSRDNAIAISNDVSTLAETLAGHGYSTAGSVGHFLLSGETSGLDRGFDYYQSPREPGLGMTFTEDGDPLYPVIPNEFRPWQRVNRHARNWLSGTSGPWFLFLHYYECHAPYEPESPWNRVPDFHPYDGEIAGIDRAIADALRMVAVHDNLSDTEIIVTSDHGESLGEHGYTGHGLNLHTQSMHIPWISSGHSNRDGVQTGLRQVMDIKPTILADRNIPVPAGLDGVPDTETVDVIFGESPSLFPDEPQRRIRSIRNDRFTLVYHRNADIQELYSLTKDPGEKKDVSDSRPVKTTDLINRIHSFAEDDTDMLRHPEEVLRPQVKEALRALGYLTH